MSFPRPNDRPVPFGVGLSSVAQALSALHSRSVGMNSMYGGRPRASGSRGGGVVPPRRPPAGGYQPPPRPVPQPNIDPYQSAAQQVYAMLDPLIQQITAAENARAASGQQAIGQFAQDEQKLLAGYAPQVGQMYGGAMGAQNAIDNAIRSTLTGTGGAAAAQLGQQLQQIQADPQTAARLNTQAAQNVSGAAGAGYASDSATLSALNQEGAAAQAHAMAQPGIAALSGVQQSKLFQQQTAADLASQLSDIQKQFPGLLNQVEGQQATQAYRQADLALRNKTLQSNNKFRQQTLNSTNAYRQAEIGLKSQGQNSTDAYRQAALGLRQQGLIDNNTYRQMELALRQQGQNSTDAYRQATLGLRRSGVKVIGSDKQGRFMLDPQTGKLVPLLPPVSQANTVPSITSSTERKIAQGVTMAKNGYYAFAGTGGPNKLPTPANDAQLSKYATAAGMSLQQYKTNRKQMAQDGIIPVHVADSSNQDPLVNKIYKELIDQFGLSRQQAFDQTKRFFPGWGGRNAKGFFPKGEAPQAGATGASFTIRTPSDAQQYAAAQARRYGWTPQDMAALTTLWNGESGWNYTARNPTSGALGIPQALGHTLPADYTTNPRTQIDWGMKYIKARYGSPSRALAFWQSNSPHWY